MNKILVDFDSIVDTRLGVLSMLDAKAAIEIANHPDYRKRSTDDFSTLCGRVRFPDYRKAWEDRTENILFGDNGKESNCVFTNIFPFLRAMCIDMCADFVETGDKTEFPKLVINTYPYVLNENEERDIAGVVSSYIGPYAEVSCVFKPFDEMSLKWIFTEGFVNIVLYSALDWLQPIIKEASEESFKIPSVVVHTPGLVRTLWEADEALAALKQAESELGLFQSVQQILAPIIGITFLEPYMFSMFDVETYRRDVAALTTEQDHAQEPTKD